MGKGIVGESGEIEDRSGATNTGLVVDVALAADGDVGVVAVEAAVIGVVTIVVAVFDAWMV